MVSTIVVTGWIGNYRCCLRYGYLPVQYVPSRTHYVEAFTITNYRRSLLPGSDQEVVDPDLIAGSMFQRAYYCFFYFIIIDHDTHSLSAVHSWGVPVPGNLTVGCFQLSFVYGVGRTIVRIRNASSFSVSLKRPSLLQYPYCRKRFRWSWCLFRSGVQPVSGLFVHPAVQLHHMVFQFNDLPQVFPENGFKVQFVSHVEIGRNCFGLQFTMMAS